MLRNASLSMFVSALAMIACARSHVATPPAANSISIELRPSTVEIRPVVAFEYVDAGTRVPLHMGPLESKVISFSPSDRAPVAVRTNLPLEGDGARA